MSLCLIDDAKVRRFWEVGKHLADFRLRLWRQGQPSATKRRQGGRIVSQRTYFRHGFLDKPSGKAERTRI